MKNTFASNTFSCRMFRCGTWQGVAVTATFSGVIALKGEYGIVAQSTVVGVKPGAVGAAVFAAMTCAGASPMSVGSSVRPKASQTAYQPT